MAEKKKKKEKKFKTSVYFEPEIHSALRFYGFETRKPMNDLINEFCKAKLIELGILKEDEVTDITPAVLSKLNTYYAQQLDELKAVFNDSPGWFNQYETEIKGSYFLLERKENEIAVQVNGQEIQNKDLGFDKDGNLKVHFEGGFEEGVPNLMDFVCLYDKVLENLKKKLKKYDETLIAIIEK